MLRKFFGKKLMVIMLAIIMMVGQNVFGQEQSTIMMVGQNVVEQEPIPSIRISVASDTPPAQSVMQGTFHFPATKLIITVSGCGVGKSVKLRGVTIQRKGLGIDTDLDFVLFVQPFESQIRIVWGWGVLQNGTLELEFDFPILLNDGDYNFGILADVSKNAPSGNFSLGITDMHALDVIIVMPGDGAFGNTMTIISPVVGSLKVVTKQTTLPFADIGVVLCVSAAILRNSKVEPVVVEDVIVRVDGDFAYGDLEQLAVEMGESGVVRVGPVEPGGVYHFNFNGNWRFEKSQEQKIEVSLFVKSGAGKKFSVTVVDIIAIGETYGFQVPVEGLPIGGDLIGIIGDDELKTGFYGYVRDIITGKPLKSTVLAIHEETREIYRGVSEEWLYGYFEIAGIRSGTYWLFCFRQSYWPRVQKETLLKGESKGIDFRLQPYKLNKMPVTQLKPKP